ncbi:hypothetical protein ACIO3O_19535 [Streptomyces sp. NPDC087440]|uniref:hypothetical protein n=1 Tax=Streptomyces sp. NPDC087440 TaxID=3365790 RepID=UPI0037FEA6D4
MNSLTLRCAGTALAALLLTGAGASAAVADDGPVAKGQAAAGVFVGGLLGIGAVSDVNGTHAWNGVHVHGPAATVGIVSDTAVDLGVVVDAAADIAASANAKADVAAEAAAETTANAAAKAEAAAKEAVPAAPSAPVAPAAPAAVPAPAAG